MKTVPSTLTTTSDRLTNVLSYGALLLLGYVVYLIFEPFLVPLTWSAVLAIFFYPVHERLAKRLKPNYAAMMSTVGVTVLLIAPTLVVLSYTAKQAIDATARLQTALMNPERELPAEVVAAGARAASRGMAIDRFFRAVAAGGREGCHVSGRQIRSAG